MITLDGIVAQFIKDEYSQKTGGRVTFIAYTDLETYVYFFDVWVIVIDSYKNKVALRDIRKATNLVGHWEPVAICPSDPEFFNKLRSHLDLWLKALK